MSNQIFSEKAMKKLHTTDDMEQYVKIATPRIWLLLCACALLLAGLLVWAFFGTAATTVETNAVLLNGEMQSFLPFQEFRLIRVGDQAYINDTPWTVSECSSVPLSRDTAIGMIGSDYLYDKLIKTNISYVVTFTPDQAHTDFGENNGIPVNAIIYTQEMHPIDLILNR